MANSAKITAKAESQKNRAQLLANKAKIEANQHKIKHLSKRPQPRVS